MQYFIGTRATIERNKFWKVLRSSKRHFTRRNLNDHSIFQNNSYFSRLKINQLFYIYILIQHYNLIILKQNDNNSFNSNNDNESIHIIIIKRIIEKSDEQRSTKKQNPLCTRIPISLYNSLSAPKNIGASKHENGPIIPFPPPSKPAPKVKSILQSKKSSIRPKQDRSIDRQTERERKSFKITADFASKSRNGTVGKIPA